MIDPKTKRSEVPEAYTWNLKDMFESDEAWMAEYEALKDMPAKIAGYQGRLGESAETLLEYLRAQDELELRLSPFYGYASCKNDQDQANAVYQDMRGKAMSCLIAISSAGAFATPEIMAIDEDRLNLFYVAQPELETYRRSLYQIRRRAAHILSAQEERLLASAGEISRAPENIGSVFRNADLKYPSVKDGKGEEHALTGGSYGPLMESDDRVLRRNAFETLYGRIDEYKNTIAATLDAQFKQLRFFSQARKYGSTIEASLDRTEVPVAVYTNLIEAVHANLDKMYRYVALRKKLLGVDELHFYDLYSPLVPGADAKIPFEQAKQTVYESLAPMGEDYRRILKEGFENRWIDVYQNVGKRSGAYSAGAFVHPYVLLNYTGTLDSQFTLAHEMGHALHSWHSNKYQNPVDADYVIFVAEVASTCNEALLMEHLLSKTTDKKERAYLINHFLEQFRTTLYRQTMFAEFELIIGQLNQQGVALTAERMCEEYKKLNHLYFGDGIVLDDEIAYEWERIPHFYYNYYVFQYATGYSAAIALSRRILREGEKAVKDYVGFLSGGCSKDPIDLLKGAGVDMSSPEPVNQALALFGELIDEMEALMAE